MIAQGLVRVTSALVAAGVLPRAIKSDEGPLEWPPAIPPYAEITLGAQRLIYDGTITRNEVVAGVRTRWRRQYKQTMPVQVLLMANSRASLDVLLSKFLAAVPGKFLADNQWVRLDVDGTSPMPSPQRDRWPVIVNLVIEGGIYSAVVTPAPVIGKVKSTAPVIRIR